jgi:hypothetical protein
VILLCSRSEPAPVALAVSIVIARQIVLPRRFIRLENQRLVNASEEVVGVIWAELDECCDVLFDTRRRQAPHEIEHRINDVGHDGCAASVDRV